MYFEAKPSVLVRLTTRHVTSPYNTSNARNNISPSDSPPLYTLSQKQRDPNSPNDINIYKREIDDMSPRMGVRNGSSRFSPTSHTIREGSVCIPQEQCATSIMENKHNLYYSISEIDPETWLSPCVEAWEKPETEGLPVCQRDLSLDDDLQSIMNRNDDIFADASVMHRYAKDSRSVASAYCPLTADEGVPPEPNTTDDTPRHFRVTPGRDREMLSNGCRLTNICSNNNNDSPPGSSRSNDTGDIYQTSPFHSKASVLGRCLEDSSSSSEVSVAAHEIHDLGLHETLDISVGNST